MDLLGHIDGPVVDVDAQRIIASSANHFDALKCRELEWPQGNTVLNNVQQPRLGGVAGEQPAIVRVCAGDSQHGGLIDGREEGGRGDAPDTTSERGDV